MKEHPKTRKEAVEGMREIMNIPDELILKWLEEASTKKEKEDKQE